MAAVDYMLLLENTVDHRQSLAFREPAPRDKRERPCITWLELHARHHGTHGTTASHG
jgi:hypothetical protein